MRAKTGAAARVWGAATAAVGAAALLRPRTVAEAVSGGGSAPDPAVVRVLGGRQLLQGTAVLIRPAPLFVIGGVAVDVLHATSMVAAAVIWPGYRRAALTSAAVAGSLRRRRCPDPPRSAPVTGPAGPESGPDRFPPQVLRDYALLADGERGAVLGPHGRHRLDVRAPVGQRRGLLRAARRPGRVLDHPGGPVRLGRLLRRGQHDLAQPLGHQPRHHRMPGSPRVPR